MIDYTTLQIEPIPLAIISLQKTNSLLKKENELFKDIVVVVLIGSAIFIGYSIYKKLKEDEQSNIR